MKKITIEVQVPEDTEWASNRLATVRVMQFIAFAMTTAGQAPAAVLSLPPEELAFIRAEILNLLPEFMEIYGGVLEKAFVVAASGKGLTSENADEHLKAWEEGGREAWYAEGGFAKVMTDMGITGVTV